MNNLGSFQIGETFWYSLGPRRVGETVRAVMKQALGARKVPPLDAAEIAVFDVADTVDDEGKPVWKLTLPPSSYGSLVPGVYVIGEWVRVSGVEAQLPDPAFVTAEQRVPNTGPV